MGELLTTICIVNFNTLDFISLCLDKIREFTKPGTYKIIVTDNGSNDGSVEYLRRQKDILLIEDINIGHGPQMSKMVKKVDTPYLVSMDSDAHPISIYWLPYLIYRLSDKVKCVGIRCIERDYVHPSCLLIETKIYNDLNLTFDSCWGSEGLDDTRWDVGEKISMDLKKLGYEIEIIEKDEGTNPYTGGGTFGNLIYHHAQGTVYVCRMNKNSIEGKYILKMKQELFERYGRKLNG